MMWCDKFRPPVKVKPWMLQPVPRRVRDDLDKAATVGDIERVLDRLDALISVMNKWEIRG